MVGVVAMVMVVMWCDVGGSVGGVGVGVGVGVVVVVVVGVEEEEVVSRAEGDGCCYGRSRKTSS